MPAAHKPDEKTRKQVTMMTGIGLKQEDVARIMGVSIDVLRRYYQTEMENAQPVLNAQVANNLFRIATSPEHKQAVTAAIFWLKTRAKWKETLDLSNEDGSLKPEAVQVAVMSALRKAHDD